VICHSYWQKNSLSFGKAITVRIILYIYSTGLILTPLHPIYRCDLPHSPNRRGWQSSKLTFGRIIEYFTNCNRVYYSKPRKPFGGFELVYLPYYLCVYLALFGGHKILNKAKVQRSETFADVNVVKLEHGPLSSTKSRNFVEFFARTRPRDIAIVIQINRLCTNCALSKDSRPN